MIFWMIWTRNLGHLLITRCHTSTSCTLLLIFMTFDFKIKCLWQHPATSNHLVITEIERTEASDPFVTTNYSFRQMQIGTGIISIKPGFEELINLLSSLSKLSEIELPLKYSEMMILLFRIFVLRSEVVHTSVPDEDQVAMNLKVSQFYCSGKMENTIKAPNQLRQCHITPEELEVSQIKIIP